MGVVSTWSLGADLTSWTILIYLQYIQYLRYNTERQYFCDFFFLKPSAHFCHPSYPELLVQ